MNFTEYIELKTKIEVFKQRYSRLYYFIGKLKEDEQTRHIINICKDMDQILKDLEVMVDEAH